MLHIRLAIPEYLLCTHFFLLGLDVEAWRAISDTVPAEFEELWRSGRKNAKAVNEFTTALIPSTFIILHTDISSWWDEKKSKKATWITPTRVTSGTKILIELVDNVFVLMNIFSAFVSLWWFAETKRGLRLCSTYCSLGQFYLFVDKMRIWLIQVLIYWLMSWILLQQQSLICHAHFVHLNFDTSITLKESLELIHVLLLKLLTLWSVLNSSSW